MTITKNYVTILCVIFIAIQKSESELGRTSLRAVSSFPGLNAYYFNLRTQTPLDIPITEPPLPDPPEKEIMKKKLCRKIFTSPLFAQKKVKWIDIDDPHVERDFAEKNPFLHSYILPVESSVLKYTNPYRPYSFPYEGVYKTEAMFTCPVLMEESAHILPYFVSREYNVNLASRAAPIVGRFVFSMDTTGDVQMEALAEEPAVGSKVKQKVRFVAEYKYMARRKFDPQHGGPPEMDPVCRLHLRHKIRLCASVFASKVLRFKYKFTPSPSNVEPRDCIKVRVSFVAPTHARMLSAVKWTFIDQTRTYDEYMIGCKAERISNHKMRNPRTVTYYVSRGQEKNTVFIYKEKFSDGGGTSSSEQTSSDGRIFVKHYLKNVSVVDGIRAGEIGEETET